MASVAQPVPPLLRRVRRLSVGVGLILTVLVLFTPYIRLAYRVPGLSPVMDTTVGLVALLLATVLFGRARSSGHAADALLTVSLLVAGLGNLLLSAIPNALFEDVDPRFVAWAPAVARLLVAAGFCAAALDRRSRTIGHPNGLRFVMVAATVILAIAATIAIGVDRLPDPVDPDLDPNSSTRPVLAGHPLAMAIQAIDLVLYATAAVWFGRRSAHTGDELAGWLSTASMLAAFARLHYLLFPSLYTEWFYSGDLLRLESFGVLLIGAGREIQGYWADQTRAAVEEERRRLARDVHDGLAQEVAFIASRAGAVTSSPDASAALDQLRGAAQRALDESRLAIRALAPPGGADIEFAALLAATVEEVARRHDADVVTDLDPRVHPRDDDALQLVRIAREAVTNACQHGRASRVHVSVTVDSSTPERGYRLCVSDDGRGFDVATPSAQGFGLVSMAERAEALGAAFRLRSEPGKGTEVEVCWT